MLAESISYSETGMAHSAHVVMVLALFGSLYVGVSISLGLNEEASRTIPLLFGLEITAPESLLMPAGASVGMGLLPLMVLLVIACLLI